MDDIILDTGLRIFAWILIISGFVFKQVSETVGGMLDAGLDAGLSIALLMAGLIVLGWYHIRYQNRSEDTLHRIIEKYDAKSEEYSNQAREHNEEFKVLLRENVEASRDLKNTVKSLMYLIKNDN